MRIESQAFWLPKKARPPREYEDSAACADGSLRYAIADGASTAYQSGEWAVACRRVHQGVPYSHAAATAQARGPVACCAQLDNQASQRLDPAAVTVANLVRTRRGGARIGGGVPGTSLPGGRRCRQMGIRGARRLLPVPRERRKAAHRVPHQPSRGLPALIPTGPDPLGNALESLKVAYGIAYPGDMFLLASDAVSQWLLKLAKQHSFGL